MKCIVVTPEKTVVDREVSFVVVPLFDGEYGIGNGHSPVVARLGAGELRLTLGDQTQDNWYVEGGFLEVANNVVSLLTDKAFHVSELDIEKARKFLDSVSLIEAKNSEALANKDIEMTRARVQLRLAEKVKGAKL